jgi:iron-regulated transporter 1
VFALWTLASDTAVNHSLPTLASRLINPLPSQPILAFILFFFLSISRLGLWVFDLTTQQLTQTMNAPFQRSSFTGVEYSFVSLFELAQHVITIVLRRPEQFKWLALMSLGAVGVSTVAYAGVCTFSESPIFNFFLDGLQDSLFFFNLSDLLRHF